MITKEYSVIRTIEPSDVDFLYDFYNGEQIYGALLDQKREPLNPTISELVELLQNKDVANSFYTVEDKEGNKKGFIALKGINPEVLFGELILLFDENLYESDSPLIEEALKFIEEKAFKKLHLRKILSLCLDSEIKLSNFLKNSGYQFEGELREVLYAKGKWHNLQTWAKYRKNLSF